MRFSKKTLALTACMILCMTMTAFGTVAYLTDRASVVNTFTVGSISITVDEQQVNEKGEPMVNVDTDDDGKMDKVMTEEEAKDYPDDQKEEIRVQENKYKLIPGSVYTKDPTMTVDAGSEAAYLRMSVKINCIAELRALLGADFLPQNYVNGWDSETWPCVGIVEGDDNTATYVFNYHEIVDQSAAQEPLQLKPLFEEIIIPSDLTAEEAKLLENLKIEIEGQAIQSAAFVDKDGTPAVEWAWEAFGEQYNQINTANGSTETGSTENTPEDGNTETNTTNE